MLLPTECEVLQCGKKTGLLKCGACLVVSYCGREHQVGDRPLHKALCKSVKKAKAKLDKEEHDLRIKPGDSFFRENPFENDAGHFWGIHETRPYMRARYKYAEAALESDCEQGLAIALETFRDMLRLNRADNLGIRDVVPGLRLRLGQDQECYDFLKWWAMVDSDDDYDYDFGNLQLPYLNLQDEDVLEPVTPLLSEWAGLGSHVPLLLLKTRILLKLRALESSKHQADQDAGWLNDMKSTDPMIDRLLGRHPDLLDQISTYIDDVVHQCKRLIKSIQKDNVHFLPMLRRPTEDDLHVRAELFGYGDRDHARLTLRHNRLAFIESPGVTQELSRLGLPAGGN